ncbi:MAG: hypothetical protein STHCBS139747_005297 [Sporothrix thermara]
MRRFSDLPARAPLHDDAWLAPQTAELTAHASKVNEEALVQQAREVSWRQQRPATSTPAIPSADVSWAACTCTASCSWTTGLWLVRMLRENYTSFDDATSNAILLSKAF